MDKKKTYDKYLSKSLWEAYYKVNVTFIVELYVNFTIFLSKIYYFVGIQLTYYFSQ